MNKSERRKASEHKQGVDFISNLPDSILLLILSRLPSTENVIRTSILSGRWKYLWTSVPSLDLKPSEKVGERKFIEFVYWVLLNRSVDLDSFSLCCMCSMWTVERWIHATVMRNVKRLDLDFCPEEKDKDMVIPHCLATCASLEVLRLYLYGTRVIFPSFSGFPALRVLNLEYMELFDDDSVKCFPESFPMLEELTLEDCETNKLDLLCISCPKLKKLKIYDSMDLGISVSVKLFCPELVFLDLYGQITSRFISEPMYSLKESVIYTRGERIRGLFPGISPVESLKTDIYVLYECMYDEHDMALPNLKTLDLDTPDTFCILEDLIKILKCCPELKSLSLNIENVDSWPEYPKLDEVGKITDPELKWVEFFEFNGEKPKIDIQGFGDYWSFIYATWGTKPGR